LTACGPRPTRPRLTARVNPTILDAMLRIVCAADGGLDMGNLDGWGLALNNIGDIQN